MARNNDRNSNSVTITGSGSGVVVQITGDHTGDIAGTIVQGNNGAAVNTGGGNTYVHTTENYCQVEGNGVTIVTGDNPGGIRQSFGRRR